MKDTLPKLMFVFSIAALVFGYGFLSGSQQVFPYQVIKEAQVALSAIRELQDAPDTSLANTDFWDEPGTAVSYKSISPSAGNESIFFLGNDLTYRNESGQPMLAWIADREGNIKHSWRHPGEIWAPLKKREAFGDTWRSYPISAYVYDNGDLLVAYQGINTFPIGMGLAKFDKDSNLIWQDDGLYHHWFSVDPNGDIYVPGTRFGESPMQIADRRKIINCSDKQFAYDTIAILGPDGKVKREIDMFDVFEASDLTAVFNSSRSEPVHVQSCDPMHMNDVRILSEERASEFPSLAPGDLLLSFRSLNAVGVIDANTDKFKWFHMGTTQHQHSPRYFRDNKILVFDNYGGNEADGTTRVVAIDVGSGQSEVIFPRKEAASLERDILSKVTGFVDVHSSRNRMLVSFSPQGLLWEIDTNSGEVLWEFVNSQPVDGQSARVKLFVATYADHLSFEMNGGQL